MTEIPILSCLIGLPLVAAPALFLLRDTGHVRTLALAAVLLQLLLSLAALANVDFASDHMALLERHRWIPSLHAQYLLGIDGISAPLLPVTALLTAGAILSSWNTVKQYQALYYALILALDSFTIGIFCALDLVLFFLFWELTLIPLFFLISLWGIGPHRRHAAAKYVLMMVAGGLLLLLGFSLLALDHAQQSGLQGLAGLSFDFTALVSADSSTAMQWAIFLLLFVGFAFKAPLFPFHVWLPTVAMEGPLAVTALLSGLKLGIYGIVRFAIPLAPHGAHRFAGLMATMGIVTALYGGLLALRQTNLRKVLAYSSVSHVGLVVIGISALNVQGLQGAVLQLINFATIGGGAFLVCGFVYARLGSTDVYALGGLAKSAPLLATAFFMVGLAGIGVPGTNGFVAENLILLGSCDARTGQGIAALLSTVVGAAAFLLCFQRAILGPPLQSAVSGIADLVPRERFIALIMALVILGCGIYPQPVMDASARTLKAWLQHVNQVDPLTTAGKSEQFPTSTIN
jgi:NADH-quinone oxidoreductase subunit M